MWILLHQEKVYYLIYFGLSLAKYKSKDFLSLIQSSSTGKKNQGIAPNRKLKKIFWA